MKRRKYRRPAKNWWKKSNLLPLKPQLAIGLAMLFLIISLIHRYKTSDKEVKAIVVRHNKVFIVKQNKAIKIARVYKLTDKNFKDSQFTTRFYYLGENIVAFNFIPEKEIMLVFIFLYVHDQNINGKTYKKYLLNRNLKIIIKNIHFDPPAAKRIESIFCKTPQNIGGFIFSQ